VETQSCRIVCSPRDKDPNQLFLLILYSPSGLDVSRPEDESVTFVV
jgi:hypothetical protein